MHVELVNQFVSNRNHISLALKKYHDTSQIFILHCHYCQSCYMYVIYIAYHLLNMLSKSFC